MKIKFVKYCFNNYPVLKKGIEENREEITLKRKNLSIDLSTKKIIGLIDTLIVNKDFNLNDCDSSELDLESDKMRLSTLKKVEKKMYSKLLLLCASEKLISQEEILKGIFI